MTLPTHAGMRRVPAATFLMGSNHHYPEEAPARRVRTDAFWIDETPVTNDQFAAFVAATGYVTVAELPPDPKVYPDLDPALADPASLVFHKTASPVPPDDPRRWWHLVPGANWRHPTGPGSSLDAMGQHPVVHVTWHDAAAYADWAGKALPSEAEYELAARGGLENADYAWGDQLAPDGVMLANYWQGLFPFANQCLDGWERTSPVRSYPPNGYGLYDLIGNVWEWTDDWWSQPTIPAKRRRACCVPDNPRGGTRGGSVIRTPGLPPQPRKVLKGGSHLCAENYCQRYRPAARHPETMDTSTGHIGFRCVIREPATN